MMSNFTKRTMAWGKSTNDKKTLQTEQVVSNPATPSDTIIEMAKIITGEHVDRSNILNAGEMLKWMDICACMSAEKHSRHSSVTVSMDDFSFSGELVKLGDLCKLKSQVNRVWNTSMEIGVAVTCENLLSGEEKILCHAYFVFVCLDEEKKKVRVPMLYPRTELEWSNFALADERRQIRFKRAKITVSPPHEENESRPFVSDMIRRELGNEINVELSKKIPPKHFVESRIVTTEMVLPPHANHMGNTFGGQIMSWMTNAASVVATRHCRRSDNQFIMCNLLSIDDVFFRAPSTVGDRIEISASVSGVFDTSLEIEATAKATSLFGEYRDINNAFFTFVAVDTRAREKNVEVPHLDPSSMTEEKRSQFDLSRKRKLLRLERLFLRERRQNLSLSLEWVVDLEKDLFKTNVSGLIQVAKNPAMAWETKFVDASGICRKVETCWQDGNEPGENKSQNARVLACRCTGHFNVPPEKVFQFLLDLSNRKLYDVTCQNMESRVPLDESNDFVWLQIKEPNSRNETDFSLMRSWRKLDIQGAPCYLIANRSIIHPKIPVNNGVIRAEALPSGFIIEGGPQEGTTSLVYTLQLCDKVAQMVFSNIGKENIGVFMFRKIAKALERESS